MTNPKPDRTLESLETTRAALEALDVPCPKVRQLVKAWVFQLGAQIELTHMAKESYDRQTLAAIALEGLPISLTRELDNSSRI